MTTNADQLSADGTAKKLVEALRLGRANRKDAVRSADLEALLPEGHPARVVWGYVVAQDAGRTAAATGQREAPVGAEAADRPEMRALWLYASVKGIGSARALADLCQSHAACRWLCGGTEVDAPALKQFRLAAGDALDQWLADGLAGLAAAGLADLDAVARAAEAPSQEERLLQIQAAAADRLRTLRARIDEAASELSTRLAARKERNRRAREAKVAAAVAQARSLAAIRQQQRQKEEEARARQRQIEEEARKRQQLDEEARARQAAEAAAQQSVASPASQRRGGPDGSPAGNATLPRAVRYRPSGLAVSNPTLPWSIDLAESARLRRVLGGSFGLFMLLSIVLVSIKPPPVGRAEAEKMPTRLAKLILEQKEAPKKPEPVVQEPPKKEPEKKAEAEPEVPKDAKEPEAKPEAPKRDLAKEAKPKASDEEVRAAREKASKSGLLVMRDQLASLREMRSEALDARGGGDGERSLITRKGSSGGSGGVVESDLITKSATTGSGGVGSKAVAHSGGGSLEARETTKVAALAGKPSIVEAKQEARGSKRTHEEIKLAFDANKSAIYGIYRRALRENPLLEGRVVLKLTIDASGQVTACSIVSSALKAPELEEKLVARIQLINFGTRPKLETWTGTYQIDFVPAG